MIFLVLIAENTTIVETGGFVRSYDQALLIT